MEVETNIHHTFADSTWSNDSFPTFDTPNEKWPSFTNTNSFSPSSFILPPSLISAGSVERFGQVTPPEELSPAEPEQKPVREVSIPLEDIRNEALFPDHQVQALRNYQPHAPAAEPPSKRRRTSRPSPASPQDNPAPQPPPTSTQQPPAAPGQPPKRKRGRPKSTPQLVEHFSADGFPFHVSSARQSHLEKNRVAAHKCRQRKKEYITGLEARAREFSSKNKALKENVTMLREEVLSLKNEVLRHAGCGFWAVDEYLAQCAGDLLGMDGNANSMRQQQQQQQKEREVEQRRMSSSVESMAEDSPGADMDEDDYAGLDFLNDIEED